MARILLIDDDEAVRTVLRHALVLSGHVVTEAVDGKEGLKLFSQEGADLVITDIIMPETEGIEVMWALQKIQPPVKIIAISGYSKAISAGYLHTAELLGVGKVLTKPFPLSVLIAAVNELLAAAPAPAAPAPAAVPVALTLDPKRD